ncbi:MAG: nucleotidyltransferase family protein [Rubrivivax sp.]|jgi:hypothetical protein
MSPVDLVIAALREPARTADWRPAQWSALLQQARSAGLLGRVLAVCSQAQGGDAHWPSAVRDHAIAAARLCRAQQDEVRRESGHIRRALTPLGSPVVLLKGAAYVMAGLPAAQGRVFSDVDILVPHATINEAESLLTLAGWLSTNADAYDQRYYRTWMHELPPMQHLHRQTTLDVHHNILPLTHRLRPSSERLLAGATPLPEAPGLFVLQPVDMALHNMAHLFMNDEVGHALRDLSDLDQLLRHFGQTPGFWTQLPQRAAELNLDRVLFYGLQAAAATLGTPVPASTLAAAQTQGSPAWGTRALTSALWRCVLHSPHPTARGPMYDLAAAALYLRGHWLRMPPWLLARHLTVKALKRTQRTTAPTA